MLVRKLAADAINGRRTDVADIFEKQQGLLPNPVIEACSAQSYYQLLKLACSVVAGSSQIEKSGWISFT